MEGYLGTADELDGDISVKWRVTNPEHASTNNESEHPPDRLASVKLRVALAGGDRTVALLHGLPQF